MAGGKETPRQKMIGMMYLVLTALLALNVSKDILDAFIRVNKGLEITNQSFTAQNEKIYSEFENQMALNKVKTEPYFKAAQEVKAMANEMYKKIHELKAELIIHVEGCTPEEAEAKVADVALIQSKDNYDIPTHLLVGDGSDPSVGEARVLKEELIKFREGLLGILKDEKLSIAKRDELLLELGTIGINTDDPTDDELSEQEKKDPAAKWWETRNFYHNVIVATITILTNVQNDVRNAESRVLNTLLNQISKKDFKFDVIDSKVVPKSTYVMSGEEYGAEIFVAAYSTTQQPIVYIKTGVDTLLPADTASAEKFYGTGGMVKYVVSAGGLGDQKYAGLIAITDPLGAVQTYGFKSEYSVGKPSANVSADKMNVFYIGLKNPITVAVPGAPAEKVNANISGGGSLVKTGPGKYDVTVSPSAKEVNISVSADMGGGSAKSMGSQVFRVKQIPDPFAIVAGKKGGAITKNAITGNPVVLAVLENFLFDGVRFDVIKFTFSTTVGGFNKEEQCNGSRLSSSAISMINQSKSGQKITFENIMVKGPDGRQRVIPSVVLKLL
ncbi:MAG: gliding motility protein GldM [Bacteroidetes bacterium]|nr:gliding motility protein GldM [Bacteroidota bacterium]MBU1717707.1 gliding motility protein GldM [Bacteroidota bacterium]